MATLLFAAAFFFLYNNKNTNTPATLDTSIAVLPFEDMSQEKDQEYFGDGIAEEILNTLTQLTSLKVTGRTSSFAFKGTKKTTPILSALTRR